MKITIVVPFYNEEANVEFVLDEIVTTSRQLGVDFEVLAVDDKSNDGTAALLKKASLMVPELKVITHERNRGQAAAFWTGLEAMTGDVVVMIDGDRQNDFRDVPRMLTFLDKYDAVFGQRARRQDPFHKLVATWIAYHVRNFFLSDGIKDTSCSLKAIKKSALKYLIPIDGFQRFVPFLLIEAGVKCIAVDVNHRPRSFGESKFSLLKLYFLPTVGDLLFFAWYKTRNLFSVRKLPLKISVEVPESPGPCQKWFFWLLGVLAILAYTYHLYFPPEPYFDEEHYVQFIREFFKGNYNEFVSNHPPLWHFLTALCMMVFGDHSWAWRLVSVLAGLGILPILYRLTKKITGDPLVARLTLFFWFFDCLSLTQARVAMMNSLLLFFLLVSMLNFLEFLDNTKSLDKKRLLLAGIFFGLAITTKLVALNMFLFFVPLLAFYSFGKRAFKADFWPLLGLSFVLLPLAIFFCVHLAIPFFKGRTLADIWNITLFHVRYHMTTTQTHPYMSPWWSWPIMSRPTWAFFQEKNYLVQGIIFIGNPLLYWTIPLAMGFVVWQFLRKRSAAAGIILLAFCSQWLCYSLTERLTLFHYFYFSMPFVSMAFGLLAKKLWDKETFGRPVVVMFLIFTAAMFIYWYPLLTGLSIPQRFYEQHMWFRSWI